MFRTYYCKECYGEFFYEYSELVEVFFSLCDKFSKSQKPISIRDCSENRFLIMQCELLDEVWHYVVTHETKEYFLVKPLGYELYKGHPQYCIGHHLKDLDSGINDD